MNVSIACGTSTSRPSVACFDEPVALAAGDTIREFLAELDAFLST